MWNLKVVTDGKLYAVRKGFWPFHTYASFYSSNSWFPMCLSSEICWGSKEMALYKYKQIKNFKIKVVEIPEDEE